MVFMELDHKKYMHIAFEEAHKGYEEGGCPIGGVLVDNDTGEILGQAHNMLVQHNDPSSHGETETLKVAGRVRHQNTTLYTTLSPCFMCTGTIIQHQIPHVVVGDVTNARGNEEFLQERGVKVTIAEHPESVALVAKFRKEKPELWEEDWGADAHYDGP